MHELVCGQVREGFVTGFDHLSVELVMLYFQNMGLCDDTYLLSRIGCGRFCVVLENLRYPE